MKLPPDVTLHGPYREVLHGPPHYGRPVETEDNWFLLRRLPANKQKSPAQRITGDACLGRISRHRRRYYINNYEHPTVSFTSLKAAVNHLLEKEQ